MFTTNKNSFPAFIFSGILAMLFGFLLVLFVRNLKGDYLALVTIGFSFIVYAILMNWISLTEGPLGLVTILKPKVIFWLVDSKMDYLILVWIIALLVCLFVLRIVKSPFGKVVEALRDNELVARSLGKNAIKTKLIIMGISAFFAGISGSLYAHYITFIDPDSFTMVHMGQLLSIVILGGLASFRGTFLATIIIISIPEIIRFFGFQASMVGPLRQIIYSIIILIIIMFRPKGFYGRINLK